MATITTRAGKGSPLTNTEVDDNFSNLNSAKYESGSAAEFASVDLPDDGKIKLGNDDDLQIYHDGLNSYVQDAGSGNLYLRQNGTAVIIDDGTNNLAAFNSVSGESALYYGGSGKKLATTSTGLEVTGTVVADNITSSGVIKTTSGLVQLDASNSKVRQYAITSSSGTHSFLLGRIRANTADGGVTGVVKAAYDYGDTLKNVNVHFTFSQRVGTSKGHWWYENTDDDSSTDVVSVKLIDDGSNNYYVWLHVGDYVSCFIETVWRQVSGSHITDSGSIAASTITSGTTLFDTANDPTSEHHIGKLYAHDDVNVAGAVVATGTITANAGVLVDNLTIDANAINVSSGDLTLDSAGDIVLDADGGHTKLKDANVHFASLSKTSANELVVKSEINNADMLFQGSDNLNLVTALTLDMADAGSALFNNNVTVTGRTTSELDLESVSTTAANTARNVFVYNTAKDSDGGAWRKRTQNTSWYNETLNTSVRGSRKDFPAVAVFSVEINKLTIYDGDDPAMPMWMVFNAPNGSWPHHAIGGGAQISCVSALNGVLAVGNSGYGLTTNNFITELSTFREAGYNREKYGGLVNRNGDMTTSSGNLPGPDLIADIIYSLDMTVVPGSPVDPHSKLPIPTIVLGTRSGINTLFPDGTIEDRAAPEGSNHIHAVKFDGDHVVYAEHHSSAGHASGIHRAHMREQLGVGGIHYFDRDKYLANSYWAKYNPSSYTHDSVAVSHGVALASQDAFFNFANAENITTSLGITKVLSSKRVAPYTTCYITNSYNTGWMLGNVQLATLSDTDTTNISGASAFTNDLFTGWTTRGGNGFSVNSNGTVSVVNGTGSLDGWLDSPSFTTVAGARYIVEIEVSGTAGIGVGLYYNYGNGPNSYLWPRVFEFTAPGTSTTLQLYRFHGHNGTGTLNKIQVRRAERDRSYNHTGVRVHGTVQKNVVATGADLVGYTGWSLSNYFDQPYNARLNLQSISVSAWVKRDSGSALRYVYARGTADASETVRLGISDAGIYFDYGDGSAYTQTNTGFPNGVWTQVVCAVRANERGVVYVNGVKQGTSVNNVAPSALLSAGTYTSLIGRHYDNNADYVFSGSIALLRVSGETPTAEEVEAMYTDEKALFQANAKATIYGNSNNITGSDYDDATNCLHAGTSAGRSVFQGLRRVDNTTGAVIYSVSASDDLVAEN